MTLIETLGKYDKAQNDLRKDVISRLDELVLELKPGMHYEIEIPAERIGNMTLYVYRGDELSDSDFEKNSRRSNNELVPNLSDMVRGLNCRQLRSLADKIMYGAPTVEVNPVFGRY